MSRDYAPIENVFATLDESSQDLGHGLGIDQRWNHHNLSEFQHNSHRPDNIPLIGPNEQQTWSPEPYDPYDSRGHRGAPVTSPAPLFPPEERALQNPEIQDSNPAVRRKPISSPYSLQNLRSIYSPDFHKHAADKKRPYAKYYDFRRTRDKILKTVGVQWLVTVAIAVAIAGALLGYEQMSTIDQIQKHIFNALITGLSICLGINLASSLRSYADLLRWRLLACSWLSLQEFDLVLGCSSQLKVIQLLLTTSKRRKFPFVSWIQTLCLLWILVNVAAQVLVAMLGLTYSLDDAAQNILSPGPVSIADLSTIHDIASAQTDSDIGGQQFAAHAYGIQGQDFPLLAVASPLNASRKGSEKLYTDLSFSSTFYRFIDYNPIDATTYQPSTRMIQATTTCTAYTPLAFQTPYFDGLPLPGTLATYNNGFENLTLYIEEFSFGAVTYISDNDKHCGDRCTRVYVFQAKQEANSPNEQLSINANVIFDCNNTISEVTNPTPQGKKYALPPDPARYIAGAIGWTGYVDPLGNGSYEHLEYQLFSNDSYWSPPYQLKANGRNSAAMFVSQFSMAALAAMDLNGRRVVVSDGLQPQRALKVDVEWGNTAALLAVIVGIQFVIMLVVVLWANKAVIKDDSFLAIAKLLAPMVMKLGEHGSVLRGDEIAAYIDAKEGGNYKVFYGWREVRDDVEDRGSGSTKGGGRTGVRTSSGGGSIHESMYGGTIMRADIIDRGQGINPTLHRAFMDGKYD